MENIFEKAKESAKFIKDKIKKTPDILIILGSGLGVLTDGMEDPTIIKYSDIPHFPVSTVEGHAGELLIGHFEGKYIACMKGRFHYYEGYSMQQVSFPVRVMGALGVKNLLVTNAAGAINVTFKPGDLMLIEDHIKFFNDGPLRGKNDETIGPRFPSMTNAYTRPLRVLAHLVAELNDIEVKQGTYAFMSGPTYETPAEVKALRIMGSDAVGMSTVPEVITAVHQGMEVLGISCITNMAAGILDKPLNHEEVIETANRVKDKFLKLVKGCINRWD